MASVKHGKHHLGGSWVVPVAVAITLLGLALPIAWAFWLWPHLSVAREAINLDIERIAQFGDAFGAVNAVLSLFAIVLVVLTLLVQQRELREATRANQQQADEMREQVEHLARQHKSDHFYRILTLAKEFAQELEAEQFSCKLPVSRLTQERHPFWEAVGAVHNIASNAWVNPDSVDLQALRQIVIELRMKSRYLMSTLEAACELSQSLAAAGDETPRRVLRVTCETELAYLIDLICMLPERLRVQAEKVAAVLDVDLADWRTATLGDHENDIDRMTAMDEPRKPTA